ncbi:pentapeptide repeat-containing protein [Oerskovia sp. Sa1BUA8]|uniref:Pentapeptide repeat-containing protein n=1 Tax=Oerskovia douganii TaxID=2762210 RepID=A0A9D5U6I2_9CELL|nr:pentapeptide repeat-containing protein [Oerskovia douganii]MBE7699133.1 pentapeptide repeat-containing protein [Oerskovia douganii]
MPAQTESSSTVPPRIKRLRAGVRSPGDATEVGAEDRRHDERFEGGDLSHVDLSDVTFERCDLVGISLHQADLRAATFSESRLERVDAPVLSAPRSVWHDVVVAGSRIGSAELYEAGWRSVELVDCKLGYVNLRGATIRDVRFTRCSIEELDLTNAQATRVAFEETSVDHLVLASARLAHTDLRGAALRRVTNLGGLAGATLSTAQVVELAPLFAAGLGLRVED